MTGMGLLTGVDRLTGRLDRWYFALQRRRERQRGSPLWFHGGWGSQAALEAAVSLWHAPPSLASPTLSWHSRWVHLAPHLWQREGQFHVPGLAEHLPRESATAYVRWVRPRHTSPWSPVVVMLPTTRESGFAARMPVARALARQGVASVLLESPFMGRRRPPSQHGATLTHFSDLLLMCSASILEARALLVWLAQQGHATLCTAGISQGGYLATVAGLQSAVPCHITAMLAPHSGQAVWLDGLLGQMCDWAALQATCGTATPVRHRMHELFEAASLEHLPPPRRPQRLTLVAARRDQYVPPESYERLERCWQGLAKVHWLPGGHVSSIAERGHYTRAILATLQGP